MGLLKHSFFQIASHFFIFRFAFCKYSSFSYSLPRIYLNHKEAIFQTSFAGQPNIMDTIQGWFTNLWAASTPSIDASIKREASTLEKYLYGSDDVYVSRFSFLYGLRHLFLKRLTNNQCFFYRFCLVTLP